MQLNGYLLLVLLSGGNAFDEEGGDSEGLIKASMFRLIALNYSGRAINFTEMTKKYTPLKLEYPGKVNRTLNLLIPESNRVYIEDLSKFCAHDVFQLIDDRVLVVFKIGIVFFNSKEDLISSIQDGAFSKLLKLDEFAPKYFPVSSGREGSKEWFLASITYYRSLDFFSDYKTLSDADLLDQMISDPPTDTIYNLLTKPLNFSSQEMEIGLIGWDKKRVWVGDLECDVFSNNKVYEMILEDWSQISRGVFLPKNISEDWNEDIGIITLQFDFDGERYQFELKFNDDWMDVNLVQMVNQVIYDTGYQFESLTIVGQVICLIVLNTIEKQQLERDRRLKFD